MRMSIDVPFKVEQVFLFFITASQASNKWCAPLYNTASQVALFCLCLANTGTCDSHHMGRAILAYDLHTHTHAHTSVLLQTTTTLRLCETHTKISRSGFVFSQRLCHVLSKECLFLWRQLHQRNHQINNTTSTRASCTILLSCTDIQVHQAS
jgi:hypothetical protein